MLLPICGIQYAANLGEAVSRGFDVQATVRPFEGATIDSTVGYDDAHFSKNADVGSGVIANAGDALGDTTSGNAIPRWKFSLGAQYAAPADTLRVVGGTPYIRGDYQFIGRPGGTSVQRDPGSLSYDAGYIRTDATNYISLRAGLTFARGLDLSLFCNNLLNSTPELTHEYETTGSELYYDTTLRPRYVGLQVTFRD